MKLKGAPEHIWLQYHGDADPVDYQEDDYPDADEFYDGERATFQEDRT